jgi:hypothetical protein
METPEQAALHIVIIVPALVNAAQPLSPLLCLNGGTGHNRSATIDNITISHANKLRLGWQDPAGRDDDFSGRQ